jgi:ferredoxin
MSAITMPRWPGSVRIHDGCTACGLCIQTCPEGALRRAPGRPSVVDARCTGCLACIEVCPRDCIAEWSAPTRRTARHPVPLAETRETHDNPETPEARR